MNMQHRNFTYAALVVLCLITVAPGAAHADSTVTLHGLADAFVGRMKSSGEAGRGTTVGNGGLTTSWFGLSGREKIGNNLTATFDLESFFQVNTGKGSRSRPGDTFFSRQATVGLKGDWGTIKLGRNHAPNFFPLVFSNPFGASTTSSPLYVHAHMPTIGTRGPAWANTIQGDAGWSNSLTYQTPRVGGFTGTIVYQFGTSDQDNSKNNIGANVVYRSGPFLATAFVQRVRLDNPNGLPLGPILTEETTWFGGMSYNFKWLKLYASYQKSQHKTPLKDKTWQLGASVPAGHGKFMLSWAHTDRDSGAAKFKRDTVSGAYDYPLSKRTDVYLLAMFDKVTNYSSAGSVGIGMRHRF